LFLLLHCFVGAGNRGQDRPVLGGLCATRFFEQSAAADWEAAHGLRAAESVQDAEPASLSGWKPG